MRNWPNIRWEPRWIMSNLDFSKLKTHSLHDASRLVTRDSFAKPLDQNATVSEFIDALPDILAVRELKTLASAVVDARRKNKPVLLQFGGHMIKCGLGPLIIDLLSQGFITALAGNGSVAVHDIELAYIGATSEDVAENLNDGRFGMTKETADFYCMAARSGNDIGLGRALGDRMREEKLPFAHESVLASASRYRRPFTVHVALGTDVVHQHPCIDPGALGKAAMTDFRMYCGVVADLGEGGVVINSGSAVIMPEVFLKAVSIARNLGHPVKNFTAANIDMIRQYRPVTNIIGRPVLGGGRGINIIGHHELVFPLLHMMIQHFSSIIPQGG